MAPTKPLYASTAPFLAKEHKAVYDDLLQNGLDPDLALAMLEIVFTDEELYECEEEFRIR